MVDETGSRLGALSTADPEDAVVKSLVDAWQKLPADEQRDDASVSALLIQHERTSEDLVSLDQERGFYDVLRERFGVELVMRSTRRSLARCAFAGLIEIRNR